MRAGVVLPSLSWLHEKFYFGSPGVVSSRRFASKYFFSSQTCFSGSPSLAFLVYVVVPPFFHHKKHAFTRCADGLCLEKYIVTPREAGSQREWKICEVLRERYPHTLEYIRRGWGYRLPPRLVPELPRAPVASAPVVLFHAVLAGLGWIFFSPFLRSLPVIMTMKFFLKGPLGRVFFVVVVVDLVARL